jgi:hypothetical protein
MAASFQFRTDSRIAVMINHHDGNTIDTRVTAGSTFCAGYYPAENGTTWKCHLKINLPVSNVLRTDEQDLKILTIRSDTIITGPCKIISINFRQLVIIKPGILVSTCFENLFWNYYFANYTHL